MCWPDLDPNHFFICHLAIPPGHHVSAGADSGHNNFQISKIDMTKKGVDYDEAKEFEERFGEEVE